MTINTTTNRLTLTKTERACLDKAAKLLAGISKHADGSAQEEAEAAFEHFDAMLDLLAEEETAVRV